MAKLLRKLKRKVSMWNDIGDVKGYHSAIDKLDEPIIAQLLDKNIPGDYREPNSIWGLLSGTSNLERGNSLKNRTWLYTVWRDDRRNVRTSYKPAQEVDDLLQLNEIKNSKGSNDVPSNDDKVDLENF
jgi:hypothetical protein